MLQSPDSIDAEAFRMLRMHLELVSLESGARTFVFVSALEKEGKTTTVCNLAVALGRAGRRVVLVDGDLRKGAVARAFGLAGSRGLTDVVAGRHDLAEAITRVRVDPEATGPDDTRAEHVSVLPVGPRPEHPGELAADQEIGRVLDELRLEYDFILIDTPPLLTVGDAMAMAARSDAVIPVARLNYHSARDLREFRRALQAMPSQPIGFVLTGARSRARYAVQTHVELRTPEPVG
jgi:non-specific protein-tyrosine kinase